MTIDQGTENITTADRQAGFLTKLSGLHVRELSVNGHRFHVRLLSAGELDFVDQIIAPAADRPKDWIIQLLRRSVCDEHGRLLYDPPPSPAADISTWSAGLAITLAEALLILNLGRHGGVGQNGAPAG